METAGAHQEETGSPGAKRLQAIEANRVVATDLFVNHDEMDGGRHRTTYDEDRRAHFSAVAAQLRNDAEKRAEKQRTRNFQATDHSDCLAVSWSGGREYRLALAFERAWTRAQANLRTAEKVSGRPVATSVRERERNAVVKACHERYVTKLDARYASEAYVFQKTSEVVPPVLEMVAPGLGCEIGRVPLHHYYLISRDQPAVDEGEAPTFTRWQLETQTYGDQQSMIGALLARIYPSPCSPPPGGHDDPCNPHILLWAVASAALVLAIIGVGLYLERGAWLSEFTDRFDGLATDVDSMTDSLAELESRYDTLERQLERSAANPQASVGIETVLVRLAELEARFNHHTAGHTASSPLGLDAAPCSMASASEQSSVPAYLFRAQIGRDGIRVFAYSAAPVSGGAQREAALALLNFNAPQPMSAVDFRRWARPAFDLSQEQDCRHFVILNESGEGTAGTYAALRAAIEDNFYIYRPAG